METIKKEINETREILKRIKNKNFSGNEGKLIKNSSLQIATSLVAKIGSLFFTIIIARLMLPEVYGLYGLALSTILFIAAFSDMGISSALTTFLSKNIDKNPRKAKGYLYLLTKYRIILIIISSLFLVLISKWISSTYYNKPIYYALLAGAIYLPASRLSGYLNSIFVSKNNFKPQLIREVIVQFSRITMVPLTIIYFLRKACSPEIYLSWIFLILALCYIFGGIYLFISAKIKHPFRKAKAEKLTEKEKQELFRFTLPLSLTVLSGVFFGYIDQIMLGHYVESQFLGFYQAAFNLTASASAIIGFSASAVFPIFNRLKGKRLERGFKKTRNITFLISVIAAIFTFLIAPPAIKIAYGSEYIASILYLRILSLLIISFPMIGLYTAYYTSQKKTALVSSFLVVSTLLNITLNYFLINWGVNYSMTYAAAGACIATVISRYFYMMILILWRRK